MTSSHPVAVISAVFFYLQIVSFSAISQDTIYIDNPSFEDIPHRGMHHIQSIEAWYDFDDYNFIEVGVEYYGQRPVNGHILVDNLSPFIPVHCNNKE